MVKKVMATLGLTASMFCTSLGLPARAEEDLPAFNPQEASEMLAPGGAIVASC